MHSKKSLDLLASAANDEAHQAWARAQKAEKKADVYKGIAEYAHKFADVIYERALQQSSGLEV